MNRPAFLAPDGLAVVVAIDHPMYSWPCFGLEDRGEALRRIVGAGADAVIASYGTIRDFREMFADSAPILKLDLTTVAMGDSYPTTEYRTAWAVEDAVRLNVQTVLTLVQLGPDFELEALRIAGTVAAACDRAGLTYLCEIMPVESQRFPDAAAPMAVAAAARTGAELGAHAIKTTMPSPADGVADAVACGIPVIVAGGTLATDREGLLADVETTVAAGAKGVAFGRNVWGAHDPEAMIRHLRLIVHGRQG